jgi:hypothetical protein
MLKTFLLAASLFAATAQAAAPQEMSLVYDLYRNGQKLGQVTDTFTRSGTRYTLTSETRASGPKMLCWHPLEVRERTPGLAPGSSSTRSDAHISW